MNPEPCHERVTTLGREPARLVGSRLQKDRWPAGRRIGRTAARFLLVQFLLLALITYGVSEANE